MNCPPRRGAVAGEFEAGSLIQGFALDPPATDWRVGPLGDAVLAMAFSPDGRELLTARHGAVDVLDARTGVALRRFLEEPEDSMFALAFSPDGRCLAAGHRSGLAVWHYADAKLLRFEFIDEQRREVYHVALSRDGRRLAAASARRVVLFDLPPA